MLLPVTVFASKLFYVKDLSGSASARILKFGTNVGHDELYCVRENEPPPIIVLFIHYFSFFQNFFSYKDFSGTASDS